MKVSEIKTLLTDLEMNYTETQEFCEVFLWGMSETPPYQWERRPHKVPGIKTIVFFYSAEQLKDREPGENTGEICVGGWAEVERRLREINLIPPP